MTSAEGLTYDDDGNLTEVYLPGDVDRDGDVDESDLAALLAASGKCEGEQGYNPNADFNGDGCVNESDMAILLARWGTTNKSLQIRHTWDAENRLVGVEPVFPQTADDTKVAFKYDYLGRRVEKAVCAWNEEDPNDPNDGYWEPTLDRKFVWYNWLLLEELDVDANGAVTGVAKKYTWGLDLAGQQGGAGILPAGVESAGGIGGLLALHDPDDDGDPNDPNDVERNYMYFVSAE
jgi:YD repeat-containing protein